MHPGDKREPRLDTLNAANDGDLPDDNDGMDEADVFDDARDDLDDLDALDRQTVLEAQVADLTDRLLRAAAETENVRKRSERERDEIRKYAVTRFAEDMLGVADNMARALDAVDDKLRQDETLKGLIDGVDLTAKELAAVLERHGIKAVDPMGQKFDPNLHQAMFEIDDPDAEPGTVVQVLRTGYTIGDRLLRAAMVGVAKKPA
jgi:molecular chaperone GrpE